MEEIDTNDKQSPTLQLQNSSLHTSQFDSARISPNYVTGGGLPAGEQKSIRVEKEGKDENGFIAGATERIKKA